MEEFAYIRIRDLRSPLLHLGSIIGEITANEARKCEIPPFSFLWLFMDILYHICTTKIANY